MIAQQNFLDGELLIAPNSFQYQTNEILVFLLKKYEVREEFENCLIIKNILDKRLGL